jgi:two-component system, NtrC family, response regulator HydG
MLDHVRADDLSLAELIHFDEEAGLFRFVGQRSIIVDAVAMGLLRKHLIESLGLRGARAVLTRFGYAQGWRLAEVVRGSFTFDNDQERGKAFAKLILLRGEARGNRDDVDLFGPGGATLLDSYEAEQHVAHLGRSDEPVCWSFCGLISGLIHAMSGVEHFTFEDRCVARGDSSCRVYARTRQGWGDEHHQELRYFTPARLDDLLDESLGELASALRKVELELKQTKTRKRERQVEVHGMVVRSENMQGVLDLAVRAAKVDSTVLVTGESGSGKERIAQLMHAESARADAPFVAINCGAIAESLLESELFGHARGAFTGASADRAGLFEAAGAGTIFLDEIGETTPAMQTKLLRALQERVVRRLGENHDRPFHARILAATNRELTQEVAAGRFRQDLLYRLKVIELRVPPLRDRRDDILPLARHLLADASRRLGRSVTEISARVADQLLRYRWPGNVRELGNAMERAVALAQGKVVELEDLPEEVRSAIPSPDALNSAIRPLDDVERDYILAALDRNDGNQTQTAKQLGIGSATLYRKLKAYGKAVRAAKGSERAR